jgi:NADPH2:quinone reductase
VARVINSATADVAKRVRDLTAGKGADIVFNTVGDPYFNAAHRSLAAGGRQILIAAVDPVVEFNILEFYRGRHTYVGIDTLAFSSVESADVLRSIIPGFGGGFLRPFPIAGASIYALSTPRHFGDRSCTSI